MNVHRQRFSPLMWVLLVALFFASGSFAAEEGVEKDPVDAILFPFFMLALGVFSYLLLTRYAEFIPYTAVMFVLGTVIGVVVSFRTEGNLVNESITNFWLSIDSELLLVAFLPGLIYHDSNSQNTHLFRVAFNQCLIFAFPMVLAGTVLTALVAYYIFPYDWSFNLAMTFGSILSATDPVAVAALLDAVGAPPRLKVHIAGESLLNDGSAIVFFTIFSERFLHELGVPDLGEDVDWPSGVSKFFRMSVGAACIGLFFGLGLLTVMYMLNRRLDREENIVQVGFTFAMAYLCYFTADVAWGTSGVIAVVTMGVFFKQFGESYINDNKLMEDYWSIIEWLLNTVLFSLGGLVWGSIISNENPEFPNREFTGRDWGYLFALYLLLHVIRFVLMLSVYPVIRIIGLKSNLKELTFQAFGGLRGAVGISLAIFLDNTVRANADSTDEKFVLQTNKLFGFVGGIAFLTLCVNGILAGPLLKSLGLADTTDTRKRMLSSYQEHFRQYAVKILVELLDQRRFQKVSFAVVRHHVVALKDVSRSEIIDAAQIAFSLKKAKTSDPEPMNIEGVLQYLSKLDDDYASSTRSVSASSTGLSSITKYPASPKDTETAHSVGPLVSIKDSRISEVLNGPDSMTLNEIRRVFLELVRGSYQKQIADGELVDREFVLLSLLESLELAAESVERQDRLNDWDYVFLIEYPSVIWINWVQHQANKCKCTNLCGGCCGITMNTLDAKTIKARLDIEKCQAFIHAHTLAQCIIKDEFKDDMQLELVEEKVVRESEAQVKQAEEFLAKEFDPMDVELTVSHKVCKIILNRAVQYVQGLVNDGLLADQEALPFFEAIQEQLNDVETCDMAKHPGELSKKTVLEDRLVEHASPDQGGNENEDNESQRDPNQSMSLGGGLF